VCELKDKNDEFCSKIITLRSDVNVAETKLKKISEDYKNLKLENEKLGNKVKKLEKQCQSLKTESRVVTEERNTLAGIVNELTCAVTGHSEENDIFNEKIEELADSLSDCSNEAVGLKEQTEFVIGPEVLLYDETVLRGRSRK
jgi:chromosome segregation ATPase